MGYGQRRPPRKRPPQFDWTGTSNELIDRICPRRHHFELAIIAAALIVSAAAVIASPEPGPEHQYEFLLAKDRVFVANSSTGEVGVCEAVPDGFRCSDYDSPRDARYRNRQASRDEEN